MKKPTSGCAFLERYLVVYSQSLAASMIRGQQQRILTARTALDKLAAKPGDDWEQLTHKVENILKRYRVNDFFSTMITEEIIFETRHVGRGRPSKNSPTESGWLTAQVQDISHSQTCIV